MKKKAAAFFLTAVLMVSSALSAFAGVQSLEEIYSAAEGLGKMAECDLSGLIGSAELIGESKRFFNIAASQYKNLVKQGQENMLRQAAIIEQIQTYNLPEDEKYAKINEHYQDADNIIYGINARSLEHLYGLERFMPTVSYQKYSKKFLNFYNGLHLSDTELSI